MHEHNKRVATKHKSQVRIVSATVINQYQAKSKETAFVTNRSQGGKYLHRCRICLLMHNTELVKKEENACSIGKLTLCRRRQQ